MIQNILFDMGNVLVRFDPQHFLNQLELTPEDAQLLMRRIFRSPDWIRMDRGILNEPEAEVLMCADLPAHLHPAVHAMVSCWDQPLLPIEGMYELVQELKQAGYRLYLLTNASRRVRTYLPRINASRFFDGIFVSAEEGVLKPGCEYFVRALNRFGLNSQECFFIDDAPANVEGAQYCGISGAVFHGDAALLRRQLRAAGIHITE